MNIEELKTHIRDIPDFPKPGIMFKDITPLLGHPAALKAAVDLFIDKHRSNPPDRVVGIESRGFIFATAMSYALGCGLALARKPGKLPFRSISESYALEYGTNTLEMHEDAVLPGERIVIVDDVLATGGTLGAACRLVSRLKGNIIAAETLVELTFLDGRKNIGPYEFCSFIQY